MYCNLFSTNFKSEYALISILYSMLTSLFYKYCEPEIISSKYIIKAKSKKYPFQSYSINMSEFNLRFKLFLVFRTKII